MYGSGSDGMFAALAVVCGLVGAGVAAFLFWGVSWVWSFVKPWLHAVTG